MHPDSRARRVAEFLAYVEVVDDPDASLTAARDESVPLLNRPKARSSPRTSACSSSAAKTRSLALRQTRRCNRRRRPAFHAAPPRGGGGLVCVAADVGEAESLSQSHRFDSIVGVDLPEIEHGRDFIAHVATSSFTVTIEVRVLPQPVPPRRI